MQFRHVPCLLQRFIRAFYVAIFCLLSLPATGDESNETSLLGPLNSDPLTERGISPRVLDIALFPMSQGIAFEMLMRYRSEGGRGTRHERFKMVFDPDTDYGRDLFIQFEVTLCVP